jgi:CheY-like chemotaxis protein
VALSVGDTGGGIPQENLDRIFEPFFTTKEVGRGSGMGLSTVHGIVHEHGGHLLVDSVPDRGTSFRVLFPSLPREEAAMSGETDRTPASGRESRIDARVLVVDDEASVAEFIGELLQTRGLRVSVRTNPLEALETFMDDPDGIDLVLTDQTMPKLVGTELAHELLRIRPELPVILYTGHDQDLSEDRIKEMGIRGYLRKPVDLDTLFPLIRRLVGDEPDSDGCAGGLG